MKRPHVVLSWAQSLDGRLATRTGDSQWIGGPQSLRFAHELRRDNDAILVGVGTVVKDNPRLTCRIVEGRNPLRVVLDPHLRTPISSHVVTDVHEAPTWLYATPSAPEPPRKSFQDRGAVVISAPEEQGQLDLVWILNDLARRGIESVFVEGGAATLTSFLKQRLADRVVVVTAPFLVGSGIEAVGDLGSQVLAEVPRPLRWKRWELGTDAVTELWYS